MKISFKIFTIFCRQKIIVVEQRKRASIIVALWFGQRLLAAFVESTTCCSRLMGRHPLQLCFLVARGTPGGEGFLVVHAHPIAKDSWL